MKLFILVILFLGASYTMCAQITGDFQSAGTVDLNSTANWQIWDGSSWQSSALVPNGNTNPGNSITILAAHQWNNSTASSIPSGVILINQGTTGTFTTSVANKIQLNGTYIHATTSSVSTILQGMSVNTNSNFIYRGSSTLTPAVSFSNRTYYNLSVESTSGTFAINLAGFAGGVNPFTVNGSFTIGAGVTVNQNTFAGTININGNVFVNGILNLNSFSVATTKTCTVYSSGSISIPAGQTLTVNGILDATTGTITGAGNFLVNGTLKTAHQNGISNTGSLLNTGIISFGTSSIVEFNAASSQEISPRSDYANLVISGSTPKTLGGTVTVAGDISLNNTNISLGNYNLIVSGNVSGSAYAYIITAGTGSLVMKTVTGSRLFPVGRNNYNPVTVSNGDGLDWTVHVSDTVPHAGGLRDTSKTLRTSWDITPSSGSSGATITFQYDDSKTDVKGSAWLTNEAVQLLNYHNGNWKSASLALTPTGSAAGGIRTVTHTGQTEFSAFTMINISGVLPVSFADVHAIRNATGVMIDFSCYEENEVIKYMMERGRDNGFETVGEIMPVVSSHTPKSYRWIDSTAPCKKTRYRVKALRNGSFLYSNIVSAAESNDCSPGLELNCRNGKLTWKVHDIQPGHYRLMMYTADGRIIRVHEFNSYASDMNGEIFLNNAIKGICYFQLQGSTRLNAVYFIQ